MNYEHFINWINLRALPLNRTHAKDILNSIKVSQTNSIAICKKCHAVSLSDTFWIKESSENLSWKDINLFQNKFSEALASIALIGSNKRDNGRMLTPELTTQGTVAKAWWKIDQDVYLYKIARKEIPASQILDVLQVDHVNYEEASKQELEKMDLKDLTTIIKNTEEILVKSKLISSENCALVTFEEFSEYCEFHELNPYKEVLTLDRKHYNEMNIVDYILNNDDRHIANWGFFMNTETGQLGGLHPLLDHDHAFSEKDNMIAQTTDYDESQFYVAIKAQHEENLNINKILNMEKPLYLSNFEWGEVQTRVHELKDQVKLYEELKENQFNPNEKIMHNIYQLGKLEKKAIGLKDIKEMYMGNDNDLEKKALLSDIVNFLKKQELLLTNKSFSIEL